MNIKITAVAIVIVIGIILLNYTISNSQQNDSSQITLTSKLPDSKIINQILQENVIGVWICMVI